MHALAAIAKAIVALIGAGAVILGIELEESTLAQIASLATAALVWLVPNRGP